MEATGVDGPWLQLVYLKIWLQIFPGNFFPIFLEFFQVLSQFLYEHLPVPTGWTNISASKVANWPEVEELVFLPTLVLQPTTSRIKFLRTLTFQLAYQSCSWRCLRPLASPVQLALDTGWCWIWFDEMKLQNFTPKHITQSEGKLKVFWKKDSRKRFKIVNGFGLQKSINCPDNDVHAFSHASKGNSDHRLANTQLSLRCQTHQLYSIVISSHVLGLPSCFVNNLYHLCIMAVFLFQTSMLHSLLQQLASVPAAQWVPSCAWR